MARPRSFDEETVLGIAMAEFWRNGFDAVTFRGLSAKTGVGLRSLSNAFIDKETLYIRALEIYVAQVEETLPKVLGQGGAGALVKLFGLMTGEFPEDSPRQNGCLIVGQLAVVQLHDERLGRVIARYFEILEHHYSIALRSGGIVTGVEEKARVLITLFVGVQLQTRLSRDTQAASGIGAHVATLIDAWQSEDKNT